MELDSSQVDPVPWRNGAGATRELAAEADSAGAVLWRISVADLDEAAEFSLFPDMDRVFVALGDVRLTIDGTVVSLQAGEQVRFRGESSTSVAVDRPTRALNVMTRRGRYLAEVVRRDQAPPVSHGTDVAVMLDGFAVDVRLTSLLEGRP